MSTQPVLQVTTTTDSPEVAESIASQLISDKLSACVQMSGPITSMYRWQGKVESSQEWVCTAKITADKYHRVEEVISKLHTYDEPEIIATEIVQGSDSYLQWVRAESGGA